MRGTVIAWVTDALQAGQGPGVIDRDLPIDLPTTWMIASLPVIDQWALTTTSVDTPHAVAESALRNLWQLLSGKRQPRK